jgi:hypothetical protein
MLNVWRLIVVIVVSHVATPLHAQTVSNTSRAFVDVALGPNWDDARNDLARAPGATWASGLAFGFDSARSGVEFNVGVPQWHVKNRAERYRYVGQSFGYTQQGHLYEESSTTRRRSIDVTVLYRANVPVNRLVTFTWLVGGGLVYRPEQYTSVTKQVLPDGQLTEVNTYKTTSSRDYLAAAARLDAEVRIARRVSVVPRVRVTAFPSMFDDSGLAPRLLMARPEIALRWQF